MKIPLVFLAYYNFDIIKESLDKLLTGEFDIYVVENHSEHSDQIGDYVKSLVRLGQVKTYIEFNENISNNAVQAIFDHGLVDYSNSDYIVVTDGDLVSNGDWLGEQLNILANHDRVFVVSQALQMDNLPRNFADAPSWVPQDGPIHQDYIEANTGGHFMMFRVSEFRKWLDYRANNKLKFCDANIHEFGRRVLGKVSAKTKKTSSRHLTWDLYQDSNHPYTKERMSSSNTWNHDRFCDYSIYTR